LSTKKVRLVIAYDGTDFCGWAAQTGLRTVQSTLTTAVRLVSGEKNEIIGASRTDSGAHAKGQVCHFETKKPLPIDKLPRILNDRLPDDLSVMKASLVSPEFHSRFCAKDRWYRYRILVGERDPLQMRFAHFYGRPLDIAAMQKIAPSFVGKHDFRAFSEELEPGTNTVRVLNSVSVTQVRNEVRIDIVGQAFVRGMMRRISGMLLEIGRGYRPAQDAITLLSERRDELQWPVVLPAKGLTLMKVNYGRKIIDHRIYKNNTGPENE